MNAKRDNNEIYKNKATINIFPPPPIKKNNLIL